MAAMFQPLTPAVTAKSVEAESRSAQATRRRRRGGAAAERAPILILDHVYRNGKGPATRWGLLHI